MLSVRKMAPPERMCGKCSESIVGSQQYIECWKCNMHYHCKCVNVVGDAYDELMRTCVTAYICKACERDAASTATKRPTNEVVRDPTSVATLHPHCTAANSHR